MDRSRHVCYTAVHGLVEAQRDPEVRCALSQAGLATEDEMPLVRWCRRSGFPDAGRVAGSDLLDAMCALAVRCDHRHYFYGGSPGVVEKLVARLTQRYPGLVVAGYRSPLFPPLMEEKHAADVAAINEARPDFVWVGLGVPPKQEKWMASHVGRIDSTPRQSLGMQRSGLEWLCRLVSELWSTIQFSWPVRYNSAQAGNPTLRTGERFPRQIQ